MHVVHGWHLQQLIEDELHMISRLESELAGDLFCDESSGITSVSFSLEFAEWASSLILSWFFLLSCQLGMDMVAGKANCFLFKRIPLMVSISDLNDWRDVWISLWLDSWACFCLFNSSRIFIISPFIAFVVFASSSILSCFFLPPNINDSTYFCGHKKLKWREIKCCVITKVINHIVFELTMTYLVKQINPVSESPN